MQNVCQTLPIKSITGQHRIVPDNAGFMPKPDDTGHCRIDRTLADNQDVGDWKCRDFDTANGM